MKTIRLITTMTLAFAVAACSRNADTQPPESTMQDYPNSDNPGEGQDPKSAQGQGQSGEIEVDAEIMQACPQIENNKAFFEVDSAQLQQQYTTTISQLAECLQGENMQDRKIEIVGHADPRGTAEHNMQLGKDRAKSVASLLTEKGLSSDRIITESKGEQGAARNDRSHEWDRRAVIRFAK